MGRPLRGEQFSVDEIAIVHCVQRCVRRAFLAGVDPVTGMDYGFRREWIRRRLEALASVFGIDVLTYAIMSNHLHVIVRSRHDVVAHWSDEEVAIRWLRVFPGRRIEEHLGEPTEHDVKTLAHNVERIAEIRERLSDISWFMRSLCEPIARMANKQDECTGRFWEGRFKAQRITDEAGLLACTMYVDLNPIRAAISETLEQSIHTSAYDRIQAEKGEQIESAAFDLVPVATHDAAAKIRSTSVDQLREERRSKRRCPTGRRIRRDGWLSPLRVRKPVNEAEVHKQGIRASNKGFLDITQTDYLRLLRWTAKQREHGSGKSVPAHLRGIVARLGIDLTMWRDLVWNFQRFFGRSGCAGSPNSMSAYAESSGRRWAKGQRQVASCFVN